MRAAEVDADRIRVRTDDGHVTLSWRGALAGRKAGGRARGGASKGVTQVTNNIEVRPY